VITQAQVDSQLARRLPIILDVERGPILSDVGQRQAFGRLSGARITEQERRKRVVRDVAIEGQSSARHVGGAAKERDSAEVESEFEIVRGAAPGHIVTDLMQIVRVKSVAAVRLSQPRKLADRY